MKPYPNTGGRPGFRTIFKHPVTGKTVSAGLDTADPETADRYCQHLQAFIDDPTLLKDPRSPRLLAYARRVREIIFGKEAAALLDGMAEKPKLAEEDVVELETVALALIERAKTKDALKKAICTALREFQSTRYKELNTELERVQRKLDDKMARCIDLENELAKVRRQTNASVTITAADAYSAWKLGNDFKALSPKTQQETDYACGLFLATLPGKMKLAELRGHHVTAWLEGLKSKPDDKGERRDLSAVTRAKMKRYLSVFVGHCYRHHDLAENPMEKTGVVKGAARKADDIEAVDRLDDFSEMLATFDKITAKTAKALEIDVPYWKALLTTAVLAGPRYAELAWLKIEDVNLEQNTIYIGKRVGVDGTERGTKTGKSRETPIETTTLQAILKAHVERRERERKSKKSSPALHSHFLFPTLAPDNIYKPRTLTPVGMWSDNGVFLDAWDAVRDACIEVTGVRQYWKYGPRQWRHCAGTAMGYSGTDTPRISDWLGTSEKMVEQHYRRKSTDGKLWAFKW